ncbi:MAG: hypothetical protein LBR17_01320, partial [Bacteroidales bacterium]|nr:hypothetical protein [Bacteroidales bacterium]
PGEAHIVSNLPYSAVHNEGGQAKVFGKYSFTMPKRQFMGNSERLQNDISDKINYEMNQLINKKK